MTEQITSSTARYTSGAYEKEQDSSGQFHWLAAQVELCVFANDGLLMLSGESPVPGRVTVQTPQTSFDIPLLPGEAKIVVPIAAHPELQAISLKFSGRLNVPGDSRALCFKARAIEFTSFLHEKPQTSNIPLELGRGLLSGNVSTTFAAGWLRMHARCEGNHLLISGILVTPLHRREAAVLSANGKPIKTIQYGLFNPDYAYLGSVAFEGVIDLMDFEGEPTILFSAEFVSDGAAATPRYQDWAWPLETKKLPMPDADNMRRIGSTEKDWFLFSGASFVEKLSEVVGEESVKDISVLDWGCGCGRLTRQLINKGYGTVTGIDIDPINIEWCKANLPDASFTLVSPDLPSKLPTATFDVIIGHSVFTHLTEIDQYLWLGELNRLLNQGGIAVVTVMANYSAAIEPFEDRAYAALQSLGFLDVGWQKDGVDSQKPGYYRRIFHTVDYVLKNWSPFFQITAVLEGYSDHQAAIVLRKLKS